MTLKCVFVLFSLRFFLSIPDKICSSSRTMCVFDYSLSLSSFLFWISSMFFSLPLLLCQCSKSCVSGFLSFEYIWHHIARVHRSRRYYHFFSSSRNNPSTHACSLVFTAPFLLFHMCMYILCLVSVLQLCFATMWCIFRIRIICMNLKAPYMFHWWAEYLFGCVLACVPFALIHEILHE